MREVTLKLNRDPSDYEEAIDEALNPYPQCEGCGAWLDDVLTNTERTLLEELRDALRLL